MSFFIEVAIRAVKNVIGNKPIQVIKILEPGSSGARVMILYCSRTNCFYVVKSLKNGRVSLRDQIKRRKLIKFYLPDNFKKILSFQRIGNYEVMVLLSENDDSLHNLIIKNKLSFKGINKIWNDVLKKVLKLWLVSKQKPYDNSLCPRNIDLRINRIIKFLKRVKIEEYKFGKIFNFPIIINGKEYASMDKLLSVIYSLREPDFGVTCHGDVQPSNIVVGHKNWYFVDWEWCNSYD